MKNYIQFLPTEQNKFLLELIKKSGLTLNTLAKETKISSRSFRDWKNERSRMPLDVVRKFSAQYNIPLPESLEQMVLRYKRSLSQANSIGGIARYKKYGEFATKEGRSKGGKNALAGLRKRGIIPIRKVYLKPGYTERLAEFIGIMLGDGGITSEQCTITLNREADKDYVQFVIQLCENLFGVKPKTHLRKDSKAITIYMYGIELINYLKALGLIIGSKVRNQVGVPSWVMEHKGYRIACLRGLMDTDGGIFLHKYKINNKSYRYNKIAFTNRSVPLLKFVYSTLLELSLRANLIDNVVNKKVWLYNSKDVSKYLELVGTSNTRLSKMESGPDGKAQVC